MYASIDISGKIIAIHDEKNIVEEYNNRVYYYHKIHLDIIKVKKKSVKKISYLDDLYLVRYGETYVQAGYLTYIQLAYDQMSEDLKFAQEIILRTLEINELSSKESKVLAKSAAILGRLHYESESYTPSLNELKSLKDSYDPYIYNYGMYE